MSKLAPSNMAAEGSEETIASSALLRLNAPSPKNVRETLQRLRWNVGKKKDVHITKT